MIGNLRDNSNCQLLGWSGPTLNSRRRAIQMLSPETCETFSNQTFCTRFASSDDEAYNARPDSPVICGNPDVVSGIMINFRRCHGGTLIFFHWTTK
jgi:hypothetical protein